MTRAQLPARPPGVQPLGSASRGLRCGCRPPRLSADGALGWGVLAALALVFLAGAYLLKQTVGYSGAVLGDLRVSQPLFSGARAPYRLQVGRKTVGWVSQLDSWYIERGYAYGTLASEQAAATPRSAASAVQTYQLAYFLFDCRSNEFKRYESDRAAFTAELARRGLPWRNFMSGENIVGMKYNQRRFDSRCEPGAPR